jgi:hypothetical protein
MGNKFVYDEKIEEAALQLSQDIPFKKCDSYFRDVLQKIGAGHCGYYPTFQDLGLIRAAQSIAIKRMFSDYQ